MKFPSFQQVISSAVKTYLRFPLVVIDAVIGTTSALILIDYQGPSGPTILFRILFSTLLGIPLLIAIALTMENRGLSKGRSLIAQAVAVILLFGYALTIPRQFMEEPTIYFIRFCMMFVAMHLLVAVAPFIGAKGENAYWQHNQRIFLGILSTLFYTFVLWGGLSLALAAINNLFGVDIPGKRYPELLVFLLGVVNTWYFLSGLAEYSGSHQEDIQYPREIKIFAQFVLFPLAVVYFLILYAYLGKIVVIREWPRGLVSALIFGFSATGIFSLLLLYPIKEAPQYRWIKSTWLWFYAILIPAAIMLFFALWRRISEYGLTEGRVLAIVVGAWLIMISLYFLFSKTRNIKIFPLTLAVIALAMCWGPWGVFSLSERNQISRLKEVLEKDSILVNGKFQKSSKPISDEDRKRVHGALSYLHSAVGYGGIQPWFTDRLRLESASMGSLYVDPERVEKLMGIGSEEKNIFLTMATDTSVDIAGYDNMILPKEIPLARGMKRNVGADEIRGKEINFTVSAGFDTLKFFRTSGIPPLDTLRMSLHPMIDSLANEYSRKLSRDIPPAKMMLQDENAQMKIRIYFLHLDVGLNDYGTVTRSYGVQVLYSLRR